MTKMLLKFALAGLLCASGLASAQNIRVDIPFQFYVGGAQMPAGTYAVRPAPGGPLVGDSTQLMIQDLDGRADKLFTGNPVTSTGRLQAASRLVFACYEKQCFLSQVWKANDDGGVQLLPTTAEKHLIAARKTPSRQVVLTALK
jgi:hypothetical protein